MKKILNPELARELSRSYHLKGSILYYCRECGTIFYGSRNGVGFPDSAFNCCDHPFILYLTAIYYPKSQGRILSITRVLTPRELGRYILAELRGVRKW